MRTTLHFIDALKTCSHIQCASKRQLKAPYLQNGAIDIAKINIVLIGIVVLILLYTLLKDDAVSQASDSQNIQMQTQAGVEAASTTGQNETSEVAEETVQVESPKSELKPASKKRKKNDVPQSATQHQADHVELADVQQATQTDSVTDNQDKHSDADALNRKETSKSIVVFNIWSLSELRLRSAYTKYMNDGSMSAIQAQMRRKEYLTFVNRRTSKCGELDDKFASNINTMEKLTFTDRNVKILECHASENIGELERLSTLGMHDS
jgi:hypothetical protein